MSTRFVPAGFQAIRRDRLLQEERHDTCRSKGKLPEPAVCTQCGAVFQGGRWQRALSAPGDANRTNCLACQRLLDHYPAFHYNAEDALLLVHWTRWDGQQTRKTSFADCAAAAVFGGQAAFSGDAEAPAASEALPAVDRQRG